MLHNPFQIACPLRKTESFGADEDMSDVMRLGRYRGRARREARMSAAAAARSAAGAQAEVHEREYTIRTY